MRINKYFTMAFMGAMALGLSSCQNGDPVFDDYEGGTTVYFARQNVVRNVVLGNDETRDNTDDNNHIINIVSTMGGAYQGRDITMNLMVDNSLCDNLYFDEAGNNPVKPMPANYYSIPSTTVSYDGGFQGRMQVKLEDAFFADPASVKETYVIPVRIKDQVGADSILSGISNIAGVTPARTDADMWSVAPKDYVLYCVKYMNQWAGFYLRRGEDKITKNGVVETVVRQGATIAKDEVCEITTKSLTECIFPVSVTKQDPNDATKVIIVTCNLKLTFDANGNITVSSATEGMTATGSGKFTVKGAKLAWGNKDRDLMTLNYSVDFGEGITMESSDQFVAQTRGNTNGVLTFTSKYIQ